MDDSGDGARDRGKLSASISNAIVGIHREYFGRGAKRTRTVMGADYIICFLEDIYTPVERTLIDAGRFPAVQATRSAFQDTMRGSRRTPVETQGRRLPLAGARRPRPRRRDVHPRATIHRRSGRDNRRPDSVASTRGRLTP